jgi:hypothetical protein
MLGGAAATPQVADALWHRLKGTLEPRVQQAAAEALVRLGSAAVKDGVVKQLADWLPGSDRDLVVRALGYGLESCLEWPNAIVSLLAQLGNLEAAKPAVQGLVGEFVPHVPPRHIADWYAEGDPNRSEGDYLCYSQGLVYSAQERAAQKLQALGTQGVRVFVEAPQAAGTVPTVTSLKSIEELSA